MDGGAWWAGVHGVAKSQTLLLLLLLLPHHFSRVQLFATPWTGALQAPPSMAFSRQEYWSGLLCPPPGDLPNPGKEPASHVSCMGRQ